MNDTKIAVAATSGFAVGNLILVENEVMAQTAPAIGLLIPVRRGIEGTVQGAHATGSFTATGLGTDFASPAPGQEVAYGPAAPDGSTTAMYTYTTAGAISPVQGTHIINGSAITAMTLAGPTAAQEGQVLVIESKNLHANTCVASPAYLGAAGATATFTAAGGNAVLKACGGKWTVIGASGVAFA
jgi:hypothetical protein